MSIYAVLLISAGLAMDAFAVAVSIGLCSTSANTKNALKTAFFFGGFQAFMPVVGWLVSNGFSSKISSAAHFISFILLAFIGLKMIYESFTAHGKCKSNPFSVSSLAVLGVATSIDALAAGVNFALLRTDIAVPSALIGITAFLLTFIGVKFSRNLGAAAGKRAELCGGAMLVAIGIKILFCG